MPVHMFARQLVSLRHFRPSFSEQHWCRWTGSSRRQLSRRRAVAPVGGEPAAAAAVEGYLTLAGQHSSELEVKKSRFLTTAWPVGSAEEAMQRIEATRDPAATHNCFAYKVGQQYRSSDDGEPGGTAGRPILAALEGEGLDGVCVLVIRYYGGIKLGAGGLVRAYGGAARECLKAAPKRMVLPKVTLALQVPFELLGGVYPLVEQFGAEKVREEYGEAVALELRVERSAAQRLCEAVQNATSGRVVPSLR